MISMIFFILFLVSVFFVFSVDQLFLASPWAPEAIVYGLILMLTFLVLSYLFGITEAIVFHKKTLLNLLSGIFSSIIILILLIMLLFVQDSKLDVAIIFVILGVFAGATIWRFLKCYK